MTFHEQIENHARNCWIESSKSDFVQLSRLPSTEARFFLEFRGSLDPESRSEFDFHIFDVLWHGTGEVSRLLPLVGEFLRKKAERSAQWHHLPLKLRKDEARLLLQYLNRRQDPAYPRREEIDEYISRNALTAETLNRCVSIYFDSRFLAKAARMEVVARLNVKPTKIPGGSVLFASTFRNVHVRTFVEFNVGASLAAYWHSVTQNGQTSPRVFAWPDLAWNSGMAQWDEFDFSSTQEAADAFAESVRISTERFADLRE